MEIHTQKKPFYVFTSIDGVLFDYNYAKNVHGPFLRGNIQPVLKKESVEALNLLLSELEKNYDTKLIITSKRRRSLAQCLSYMRFHGFNYDKPIFATDIEKKTRGELILELMKKDGHKPRRNPTLKEFVLKQIKRAENDETFENYVVIDSMNENLSRIPKNKIIKTDFKSESLNHNQVEDFLLSIKNEKLQMQ